MVYTKSPLSIIQQIEQLKKRGLIINDEISANHYLSTIGYYRLSGYWWPMQSDKVKHIFKPESTFENIILIYNFDKELRLLLFDVIESIEIALRTKLIYHLSHEISPWWFEDSINFKNINDYNDIVISIDRELQKSKDVFILQHYNKYSTDSRRPPAWKTLEVITFGTISKLYSSLKNTIKAKDKIAFEFGTVNHTFLPSWLLSIAQIRNICAHHGRLWNKNLPGRPKLLSKPPNPWLKDVPLVSEHYYLYIHLCCMKYLLNSLRIRNNFKQSLSNLLERYPNIDKNALGFKQNWETEPLWSI